MNSTGALELPVIPERMLIIGGGIIGLEMGTVYSSLGARLDVVEMLDGLMPGADRDLVKVWQQFNSHRFDQIMLKTKTIGASATSDGILVKFEDSLGKQSEKSYDFVLCSVGRRPNGMKLGLDSAMVNYDERGFIPVDGQMRTNQSHIFAIGDIVGQPMLAHKAVHEAHVAERRLMVLKIISMHMSYRRWLIQIQKLPGLGLQRLMPLGMASRLTNRFFPGLLRAVLSPTGATRDSLNFYLTQSMDGCLAVRLSARKQAI